MSDSLKILLERVEELESQAAFQDELHASLNVVVARQDAEILLLKQQMSLLHERLKNMGEATSEAVTQHEIPPHY